MFIYLKQQYLDLIAHLFEIQEHDIRMQAVTGSYDVILGNELPPVVT